MKVENSVTTDARANGQAFSRPGPDGPISMVNLA